MHVYFGKKGLKKWGLKESRIDGGLGVVRYTRAKGKGRTERIGMVVHSLK